MTPNNTYYVINEPRFLRETEMDLALTKSSICSLIFAQKNISFKQLKHWYLNVQYIRIDQQIQFLGENRRFERSSEEPISELS